MKRNCCAVREWLGAFADGELDPARAEEVKRHLEACAECRQELDQIVALGRLAKSVEHPQLAEDYWDWHRTRVWHGIRSASRRRMPVFRPSFAWPRLASLAAGAVVVLLVVFAGWRSFFPREGRVRSTNEVATEQRRAAGQTTAAPDSKGAGQGIEAPEVAGGARGEAAGRREGLAQVPAEAARSADKVSAGYAARGTGATGGAAALKPGAVTAPAAVPRSEVAAAEPRAESPTMSSAGETRARVSADRARKRIVSGPVLLNAPPVADADVTDTGTVLLSVKTDSTGRVLSAAVRRSSGSKKLDSAALRQIRQSRFKAAVRNNRSVASTFEYPVRFQTRQTEPQEPQKSQPAPTQRDGHETQPQQNQAPDDRSKSPDTGKKDVPLKEKTTK